MKHLIIIALLAPTVALAGGNSKTTHDKQNTTYSTGIGLGVSNSSASATGLGLGLGLGGAGGSASGGASSSNSSASGGNAQGGNASASGGQASAQGGASTNTNAGTASASVTHERAVQSAIAPGLAAGTGSCMGSSGVGAQGATFGLSLGSTWNDEACNRRYNAQALDSMGLTKAAVALMCQDPSVRDAMDDAETPCPPVKRGAEYTDPIVRRRLGLPPL